MGEICNQTTTHLATFENLALIDKLGCNGDSDETDVKSGATAL